MSKKAPDTPANPFFVKTIIPDDYFCDRKDDTDRIVTMLNDGANIVLTSPRRIGKSCLLHHILAQKDVRRRYHTLYVDIQNTASAEDFIVAMKKALSDPRTSSFPAAFNKKFETVTREYGVEATFKAGPLSLTADYREAQQRRDEDVITQIFRLMAETPGQGLVVFDEFQQIERYSVNITALLRKNVQMLPNTRFIYSGSSVHMLSAMFMQYNQPFYNSSSLYGLRRIPAAVYAGFCHDMFRRYGKDVDYEACTFAYDLFLGNTLQLQQTMNRLFGDTLEYDNAKVTDVEQAVVSILEERNDLYETAYVGLRSGGERNVLSCIAMEGLATGIMSTEMIRRYSLGASSSVANHLRSLTSEDRRLVQKTGDGYMLTDKFFELWIAWKAGRLKDKFETAAALRSRYEKIRAPKVKVPRSFTKDNKIK